MSLRILKSSLAKGLSTVSKFTENRTTIPVLGNVLLNSHENGLQLKATNLETSISCDILVKEIEEFSTTVPARLLSDLIAILPDEEITLDYDRETRTLKVSGQKSKNNIKCLDAEEFPPFPKFPEQFTELLSSDFKKLMELAIFAALGEEHRASLMGIHLQVSNENLSIHSADGIQATRNIIPIKCKDFEAIVPAKALSGILNLFNESVKLAFDDRSAFFWDDQVKVSILTIAEKFPDVEQLLRKTETPTATFLTSELARGCKQALLFVAERAYNPITLKFKEGLCEILSISDEIGDGVIQVPGRINTEIEVALNAKNLDKFLSVIDSNSVDIFLKSATSSIIFKIQGNENYVWIVMPIYLG